jgi:integrase
MLASINSFLLFAGWIDCKVKSIRLQRQAYCPEEQEITKAEYMRLLETARSNEQMLWILQTICATGIRVSELRYFTVEAVRKGEITVSCKNKTRRIFIPGKLKKASWRTPPGGRSKWALFFWIGTVIPWTAAAFGAV